MSVLCMSCDNSITGTPIYCSTCQIILCSKCFNICSPGCQYKSYTRLIGDVKQEDNKILIALSKPVMPEFSQLKGGPGITLFRNPKMVVVDKIINDFKFAYRDLVYQMIPYRITQRWVRVGEDMYHLDTKMVFPIEQVRGDWHPHIERNGTICLGDGDSLIKNNSPSGTLEQNILRNFNVIESVMRDFGEIGHGYHDSETCINVHTRISKTKPKPLVRIKVPLPTEVRDVIPQPQPLIRMHPRRPRRQITNRERIRRYRPHLPRRIGLPSSLDDLVGRLNEMPEKRAYNFPGILKIAGYFDTQDVFSFRSLIEGDNYRFPVLNEWHGDRTIMFDDLSQYVAPRREPVIYVNLRQHSDTLNRNVVSLGRHSFTIGTAQKQLCRIGYGRGMTHFTIRDTVIGWMTQASPTLLLRLNIFGDLNDTNVNQNFTRSMLNTSCMWLMYKMVRLGIW